jgi:D-hydroxyproline dehydrogenase subunit alpha
MTADRRNPRTTVDVVVLGAGPAGVPAALAAAEAGARVVVVDANPRAGGQFHRQLPAAFDVRAPGALHHGWSTASRAFAALADHPRIDHLADTRVWLVERIETGVRVHVAGGHRHTVTANALILATGATERVLPFPGWDLPGVMTVGAAQALVKGQGVRPGHRVLVAGTGPLLLASAGTLLAAGTDVVAVFDANGPTTWAAAAGAGVRTPARTVEAAGYLGVLARTRTPYRPRRAVIRAEGDGQVERAVVAEVDRDWRIVPGSEEAYEVDAICVSHGFTPNAGIAAALGCSLGEDLAVEVDVGQRTSVDGVFAAGEVTGVAGASVAALEGAVAGAVAAERCGFAVDHAPVRRTVRRRDWERRAARALLAGSPIRDGWTTWLEDDTIVCRCEEVPYGKVHAAIAERGACDVRSVKMTTRCGMGRCQAAMCGPNVTDLVRTQTGVRPADADGLVHRSVAEPVALGEL